MGFAGPPVTFQVVDFHCRPCGIQRNVVQSLALLRPLIPLAQLIILICFLGCTTAVVMLSMYSTCTTIYREIVPLLFYPHHFCVVT